MARTLDHGRRMVAIPGPSVMPERVLAAMARSMPNIYEGPLIDLSNGVLAELPGIARTQGEVFVAISNGHGVWEMALTNTLSRGDRVLVLESGIFAPGWGDMSEKLGLEVQTVPASAGGHVDPDQFATVLQEDTQHKIKAVLVAHVDTATSVRNDIPALRAALDAAHHPALFMVDCIASLACERYEMDAWGVDLTIGATQKGLMVPPGVAFVWAGPRAMDAWEHADLRTGYWDWGPRDGDGPHYLRYCGTPPVHHLYALREALDMLAEEGLENVWWRHQVLGGAVHAAIDAWSESGRLRHLIEDPQHRSYAVSTILCDDFSTDELRAYAEGHMGLVLGVNIVDDIPEAFRIGHMGHLNPPMILGTLGTVESVLQRMGVNLPRSGVAAAAAHIAQLGFTQ